MLSMLTSCYGACLFSIKQELRPYGMACCRKTQSYYRRLLRQNYINHDDELDPERLQEIMQQGREAGQWIVDKVISGDSNALLGQFSVCSRCLSLKLQLRQCPAVSGLQVHTAAPKSVRSGCSIANDDSDPFLPSLAGHARGTRTGMPREVNACCAPHVPAQVTKSVGPLVSSLYTGPREWYQAGSFTSGSSTLPHEPQQSSSMESCTKTPPTEPSAQVDLASKAADSDPCVMLYAQRAGQRLRQSNVGTCPRHVGLAHAIAPDSVHPAMDCQELAVYSSMHSLGLAISLVGHFEGQLVVFNAGQMDRHLQPPRSHSPC